MPSMFPRYAPTRTHIRFAQVGEFDAETRTMAEVSVVLVAMTIAETDEWEWITDTLVPTGGEVRGTNVYLDGSGELLGVLLTVGSGWHVEHHDTLMAGDFVTVPFPGPRGTARTEQMALQQLYNARLSARRQACAADEHRRQQRRAAQEAETAAAYCPAA
ncbi:hypothetical protein [Streptomyces sp. NPDC001492]